MAYDMKESILKLVKRTLALKHKLKVYDNVPAPDSHEDLAVHQLGRWELEDELRAIEALLEKVRLENVERYREFHSNPNSARKMSKIS